MSRQARREGRQRLVGGRLVARGEAVRRPASRFGPTALPQHFDAHRSGTRQPHRLSAALQRTSILIDVQQKHRRRCDAHGAHDSGAVSNVPCLIPVHRPRQHRQRQQACSSGKRVATGGVKATEHWHNSLPRRWKKRRSPRRAPASCRRRPCPPTVRHRQHVSVADAAASRQRRQQHQQHGRKVFEHVQVCRQGRRGKQAGRQDRARKSGAGGREGRRGFKWLRLQATCPVFASLRATSATASTCQASMPSVPGVTSAHSPVLVCIVLNQVL